MLMLNIHMTHFCFPIFLLVFFFTFELTMHIYLYYSGGYRGDENGYKIPAGTDIFLSVS